MRGVEQRRAHQHHREQAPLVVLELHQRRHLFERAAARERVRLVHDHAPRVGRPRARSRASRRPGAAAPRARSAGSSTPSSRGDARQQPRKSALARSTTIMRDSKASSSRLSNSARATVVLPLPTGPVSSDEAAALAHGALEPPPGVPLRRANRGGSARGGRCGTDPRSGRSDADAPRPSRSSQEGDLLLLLRASAGGGGVARARGAGFFGGGARSGSGSGSGSGSDSGSDLSSSSDASASRRVAVRIVGEEIVEGLSPSRPASRRPSSSSDISRVMSSNDSKPLASPASPRPLPFGASSAGEVRRDVLEVRILRRRPPGRRRAPSSRRPAAASARPRSKRTDQRLVLREARLPQQTLELVDAISGSPESMPHRPIRCTHSVSRAAVAHGGAELGDRVVVETHFLVGDAEVVVRLVVALVERLGDAALERGEDRLEVDVARCPTCRSRSSKASESSAARSKSPDSSAAAASSSRAAAIGGATGGGGAGFAGAGLAAARAGVGAGCATTGGSGSDCWIGVSSFASCTRRRRLGAPRASKAAAISSSTAAAAAAAASRSLRRSRCRDAAGSSISMSIPGAGSARASQRGSGLRGAAGFAGPVPARGAGFAARGLRGGAAGFEAPSPRDGIRTARRGQLAEPHQRARVIRRDREHALEEASRPRRADPAPGRSRLPRGPRGSAASWRC